ncbi:hypothetical protein ACLB6G_11120 [Zhengella sp. ZM62]|uniref:hypothetical protein n=1 Tax=Zhengella sedimenti TaxID=3390035 RepID=UPI00397595BD
MNQVSLSFDPLLAWPWLAGAAAVLALLALAGIVLGQRGAWIRATAMAALVLALANPVLLEEERDPVRSVVGVIVDRSQSQDIGTRNAEADAALEALKARLARFPEFELRVAEAGRGDRADERVETRLFGALSGLLSDVPPSRVAGGILITDGQVHDVPENLQALGFNAPVHGLITGEADEFDRRIRFVEAPRFGIAGKPLELTYEVTGTGDGSGGAVSVEVRINGELVSTEQAVAGQTMPLEIVVPNGGRNIVELSIPRADGEVTPANNRAVAVIDGIRENLRVLLVSGEPHAGERTWRNLLKSDASVDLVHFTILRPPEKQDGTPINELSLIAFPTRELFVEKIDDFDLIILDRYQHRDVLPVLYYDYIAQYVSNGGALLVAAGPEYAGEQSIARTPLLPALPAMPTGQVIDQAFHPRLTDTGERHPVTRGLEGSASEPPQWSRWFRQVAVDRPEGEVVMRGVGERPLLILNRHGEGRVAQLLSDQGWLWARGFEGGGPHVALYRRIAHWLMREPELEEERLTAEGRGMLLEVRRQTMAAEAGSATVILPSGKTAEVPLSAESPGIFTGTLEGEEIGLYQVANDDLFALAHVGPVNAPEFAETVSTTAKLDPIAKASGGAVRRLAGDRLPGIVPVRPNAPASGRDWLGLRSSGDSVLRSLNRTPLFAGFLGLGLLLLALGSMWWREGR